MSTANIKPQGIHHIAFSTRDTKTTYDFYHNKLGMNLVLAENHRQGDGYFRHFFFDMGNDQMIAFFEVNGIGEKDDFKTDISDSVGLPLWVNHVAFKTESEERYEEIKTLAKANGIEFFAQIDHDWLKSVYFIDPNGIMLEYTYEIPGTRDTNPQSPEEAYKQLFLPADQIPPESSKEGDIELDV